MALKIQRDLFVFKKTMRFSIKTSSKINPEKKIGISVFLIGLILQVTARTEGLCLFDRTMWANEIKYFLDHDPRAFNLFGAYGFGTSLLGLGSLLHLFLGFSYITALDLGLSILIAGATAASSVLCFLLYPNSKWWLATTFVLLLNRMYMVSTPPTTIVMPFVTTIVLLSWWLWKQQSTSIKRASFFLFGVVVGLAGATRLDATLLISLPLFLLLLHQHGRKVMLPICIGAGISFFVSDPFLWFMPLQHLFDLVYKFLIHYTAGTMKIIPGILNPFTWINYTWLSVLSIGWAFVLLGQGRLGEIIPTPIIFTFLGISLVASIGIFTSHFKAVRYLFPLTIVWEIFLPLFALETIGTTNRSHAIPELIPHAETISKAIIVFFALLQLLGGVSYRYFGNF